MPTGLALLFIGFQSGVTSDSFQVPLALMLFLAGLAILHGIKIQNRFSGILGFTKIMMLCWLIAELLRLSTWQAISAGKLTWFAGMSGAITVISLLVIALLRLRFPYLNNLKPHKPCAQPLPKLWIKLQRQYNPNACPSCGATLKCAGLIGFRSVRPLTFIRSGANQLMPPCDNAPIL